MSAIEHLTGLARAKAIGTISENHYTRSVPAGKSYYLAFGDAIIVWSIPANKNIAKFLLGAAGSVWELARLWAPNGHERNLLTRAISAAVRWIVQQEKPDALVSYADPNVGHSGGVYRAASWVSHGTSDEVRSYKGPNGAVVSRRAFHSGSRGKTKSEIEAMGYQELRLPGKRRFVKAISRRAKHALGGVQ